MAEERSPNWKKRLTLDEWARGQQGQIPVIKTLCPFCDPDGHPNFPVPEGWSGVYTVIDGVVLRCPCCLGNHPKGDV